MLKAIIIDDEQNAIDSLKWEIDRFCQNIEVIGSYTNPSEALEKISVLKPDCIFLDIEMPEMDGFQLLESLDYKSFELIITTAYDNYAIRAFKENPVDYLLKPIDSDDLVDAIDRVRQRKEKNELGLILQRALHEISPKSDRKKIPLNFEGKVVFVNTDDISYCKSDGNYTEIYLHNGKKYVVSKKLKEIEQSISNNDFFRVHNSYLVNLNTVSEYVKSEGHYLVLEDDSSIPVSRAKKSQLVEILSKF